jgi:hypothetical protein
LFDQGHIELPESPSPRPDDSQKASGFLLGHISVGDCDNGKRATHGT